MHVEMSDTDYALGHAEAELRRLSTQARLIGPITRRFLEAAGIAKGMRILDIGSGAGDVALLCGELVGPTGEVVGTDLALAAVERAERRVKNAGSSRISFRQGDPADLNFDESFDAIVGRSDGSSGICGRVGSSYSTNLTGMVLVRRRRRPHMIKYACGSAVQSRRRGRKCALVRDLVRCLKMPVCLRRP